jgi:hypothetical protein
MELKAATTLDDVYQTLSPEPLLKEDQFHAFYKKEINAVRGGDKVAHIALGLRRAHGGAFYKAFMMGHPGVGKSTELTRLSHQMRGQFYTIRFSAVSDLDAAGFKPFDVLLVMMTRVVEETKQVTQQQPSQRLLDDIQKWFATEKVTDLKETKTEASASAGIGPKAESPWATVLGLFAHLKGELKYTADRKKEVVEYRLHRLSSLISLVNSAFDECSLLLREYDGREWLFVGEDFDKPGIPFEQTESLFLNYANIFKDLHTHLIFNIPISLVYSERASQLPFSGERIHCIPDTPVFHQDHTPHEAGRDALKAVLEARVIPDLFEDDQMTKLIVASGGNLRDLFQMTAQAADNAILRQKNKIGHMDADAAINILRTEYERRLGESPYDEEKVNKITYDMKAERLKSIYACDPVAKVPAPVLYSLLRARAVQEFNGTRWFGVHPLVVDILRAQGKLTLNEEGKVAGGTD